MPAPAAEQPLGDDEVRSAPCVGRTTRVGRHGRGAAIGERCVRNGRSERARIGRERAGRRARIERRARAERLRAGAGFRRAAVRFPMRPSAVDGDDVGWFSLAVEPTAEPPAVAADGRARRFVEAPSAGGLGAVQDVRFRRCVSSVRHRASRSATSRRPAIGRRARSSRSAASTARCAEWASCRGSASARQLRHRARAPNARARAYCPHDRRMPHPMLLAAPKPAVEAPPSGETPALELGTTELDSSDDDDDARSDLDDPGAPASGAAVSSCVGAARVCFGAALARAGAGRVRSGAGLARSGAARAERTLSSHPAAVARRAKARPACETCAPDGQKKGNDSVAGFLVKSVLAAAAAFLATTLLVPVLLPDKERYRPRRGTERCRPASGEAGPGAGEAGDFSDSWNARDSGGSHAPRGSHRDASRGDARSRAGTRRNRACRSKLDQGGRFVRRPLRQAATLARPGNAPNPSRKRARQRDARARGRGRSSGARRVRRRARIGESCGVEQRMNARRRPSGGLVALGIFAALGFGCRGSAPEVERRDGPLPVPSSESAHLPESEEARSRDDHVDLDYRVAQLRDRASGTPARLRHGRAPALVGLSRARPAGAGERDARRGDVSRSVVARALVRLLARRTPRRAQARPLRGRAGAARRLGVVFDGKRAPAVRLPEGEARVFELPRIAGPFPAGLASPHAASSPAPRAARSSFRPSSTGSG